MNFKNFFEYAMKTFYRILILTLFFLQVFINQCFSNDLELTREFNIITSKNASGYLKPLFTTIGEGLNTSLYNTAYHSDGWSFGMNFSAMWMLIPESHLNYNAELPDLYGNTARVKNAQLNGGKIYQELSGSASQPTLYGGQSHTIFSAAQNSFAPDSFYKSVGFLEGNDIGMMPALPVAQFYVGFPTRTEMRFRFLTFPMQEAMLYYYTIALNQNIDKLFEINKADDPFSFGITAAYHSLTRDRGINVNSFGFGLIASNKFSDKFTVYGGIQFETISGNILLVRKNYNSDDVLNSPYLEIRNGENLDIKVESYNSARATAGIAYDWSVFRFHGDISYAAQPVLNCGVSVKFIEHIEEVFEPLYYEPVEPVLQKPEVMAVSIKTKPYQPVTMPIAVIKEKIWDFDISMNMLAIDENQTSKLDTIIIEEFESRQTRAILPYLFYEENQSDIPSKYHTIQQDETKSFSFSALSGKSPLESYYDVLNVIGSRMQKKPSAVITLTGTNSNTGKEKNNTALSKKRSENIKKYFTEVWGIEDSRIITEFRNLPKVPSNNKDTDGQEENRRVEISSNDMEITAPVFIVDTLLRVHPDAISYLPVSKSEAGLAKWTLSSSSGGNVLKSFSGSDSINLNYDWYLKGEGIKKRELKDNLKTTFRAFDKENNMREITMNHPVKIISVKDKRLNSTKDTSMNVYNLILFDFNKSTLNESNRKITDFIKSEITPQTDVTIFGYTDRIGEENYNLKLSAARSESTGKSLGGHPYKSVGVGETKLIYDNMLPEGRFYCRTVIVEAKVPIN